MKTEKELKEEIKELVEMFDEEEGTIWASENETYMDEQRKKLELLNIQLKTLQERNAEVKQAIEDEIKKLEHYKSLKLKDRKKPKEMRELALNNQILILRFILQKLGLSK